MRFRVSLAFQSDLLGIAIAVLCGTASPVLAQQGNGPGAAGSMATLETQVAQLEGEMQRIEALWQGPVDLTSQNSLEERLSQGELYYMLAASEAATARDLDVTPEAAAAARNAATHMYELASLALYGAITPPDASGSLSGELVQQPGYLDGVYFLAESLYALSNFSGARIYFEQLLRVPGHSYQARAIVALLDIGARLRDQSQMRTYYQRYLEISGESVPGEVRYLYGKALLLDGGSAEALAELGRIAPGDTHHLRAQYLMGTAQVEEVGEPASLGVYDDAQKASLEAALARFRDLTQAPPVVREDSDVIELAHLACGRLLYELDRLDEALDAYQNVPWESSRLADMLYEATWTYVRRGQLALADPSLSEAEARQAATVQYEWALKQLDDLRALEPEGERAVEVDLLAANLHIQRAEFAEAHELFDRLSERWGPIDQQVATLLDDPQRRSRIIDDILAMETGALTIDSELPPLAARRAAADNDVRDAIRVFREINRGSVEAEAAESMIAKLEGLLASENRTERFPQIETMLTRAIALDNNVIAARASAADLIAAQAGSAAEGLRERLQGLRKARAELQDKLATMPRSTVALNERRVQFGEGYKRLDQSLHEKTIELNALRAQLSALDAFFAGGESNASTAPQAMQNTKRKLQELSLVIQALEAQEKVIRDELEGARTGTTVSGGTGSAERDVREQLDRLLESESALLSGVAGADVDAIRAIDLRAKALRARNQQFIDRIYQAVDAHVAGIRQVIAEERRTLADVRQRIERVNREADGVRSGAASVALEHVRADLHDIVVRSDVGVIDVAFARKQAQTERIGRIQRAKTKELTELNQAYADLTKDDPQ